MTFRLKEVNTRFAIAIVHPITKEVVSAETLYNAACDALGYVVMDHIGDLILDNLDYDSEAAQALCGTDSGNLALSDAVYAWADSVRAAIKATS